jgi:hypothetical protein
MKNKITISQERINKHKRRQMKNHLQHYMNDIHLKREGQDNSRYKTGLHQNNSTKINKYERVPYSHIYVADWQVPRDVEPNTRA